MRNKIFAVVVVAVIALAIMNWNEKIGFANMRGFSTLPVDQTAATNQTVTGTWSFTAPLTLTNNLFGVNASLSGGFELTTNSGDIKELGDLYTEDVFASGSGRFGSPIASGSGYDFQVISDNTSTSSLDFDSGGAKGTCIQLRATDGSTAYCRVVGTTFTCDAVS